MANDLGIQEEFADFLSEFLDESDNYLNQLNENLLTLDEWIKEATGGEGCDLDLLNEMFRAAHSLKGLSGMMGLNDINNLTHKVENIFDAARNAELTLTGEVVQVAFQAVDRIQAMIDRLKDPSVDEVECESIANDIRAILENSDHHSDVQSQDELERVFAESELGQVAVSEPPAPRVDHFADIQDATEISAKYLAIFVDEAEISLEALSETLVAPIDAKSIDNLLINCHKVKGAAASIGLNRAAKLAHYMEDLLQELQQSGETLSAMMADLMLRCADALRTYNETLSTGDPDWSRFNEAYCDLQDARDGDSSHTGCGQNTSRPAPAVPNSQAGSQSGDQGLTDAFRKEIAAAAPAGKLAVVGRILFEDQLPLAGLKACLLYERLIDMGEIFFCCPPKDKLEDLDSLEALEFGIVSTVEAETVSAKLQADGVEGVFAEAFGPMVPAKAAAAPKEKRTPEPKAGAVSVKQPPAENAETRKPRPAQVKSKPAETLRVDIERLDQLMNLAGQLVINKARFGQIGDGLKVAASTKLASHALSSLTDTFGKLAGELGVEDEESIEINLHVDSVRAHVFQIRMDLERLTNEVEQLSSTQSLVNELGEAVHQLDRVSDSIQKSVMDTRMVPIGPLFSRFKRVIRDLTRVSGHDIRLQIHGEKTELDKRMIDELGDPLIHMVRNAADHGIESPEDRAAAGKTIQGTVTLDAFHRGNQIVVQVCDDGRGLDPEKIRSKAISRGVISDAEAEKMTNHQIYQLVWEPGLSTAEKVTEISGRGMGMDIVRSKIEELSGTVDLNSELGVGTTFSIKLPLTMAILPSLLVDLSGEVFAIPVETVVEIVRVTSEDLCTVYSKTTASVRGRVVSVAELSELFDWNQPPRCESDRVSDETTLVIVGAENREIGLIVHDVLGEEDIVIKSMSENYRDVEGLAGASILGDGRVSLILDVGTVIDLACRASAGQDRLTPHLGNRGQNADSRLSGSGTGE